MIQPFMRRAVGLAAIAGLLTMAGCAKKPPAIVPVSGILLLDGKPLAQAKVEFVPDTPGLTADAKSFGITDEQGKFTLANVFTQAPGAVVGKHHVLVTEVPTPREFRSQDPAVQARYAAHLAKLGNRPIPQAYSVLSSGLEVDVTVEPKEYKIELKRNP